MIYVVSKIDAAVDQLDWAIKLLLDHKAFIPAITLAGAAEEILGRAVGSDSMMEALIASLSQEHSIPAKTIRDAYLNKTRNWLKHWSGLKDVDTLDLELENEAICMIIRAIGNLPAHDRTMTSESPRFLSWLRETRPDLHAV